MLRPLLFSILLLHTAAASALVQRYVATEHESRWETKGSALYCEMSHEIPFFGRAVFAQRAGGELQLTVQSKLGPHKVGSARLLSTPPSWKHGARERDLGHVNIDLQQPTFSMPHVVSRRVLAELEQGMFPTFSYEDWADGRDKVEVSLSAVNVRSALGEFTNCLAGVIPYSFDDVRLLSFNYRTGQVDLSSEDKKRLDELAAYVLADPSISKITVSSHTDNRGYRSINMEVSRERGNAVRDYLVSQGVDIGIIAVRAYGESRPRASNRTERGRAMNRYVEVNLLK